MAEKFSTKRLLIDKANSSVVIVAGVAAFICVFSLVATKTLISQSNYQNRVIHAKQSALKQLKSDVVVGKQLATSYKAFTSTSENLIGGDPGGTGPQDGDNTKIVLDALPSTYDFPAFITSMNRLLDASSASVGIVSSSDDSLVQATNQTAQPVVIPFQFSASGNYAGIQSVISQVEHSIRPIQVLSVQIGGNQDKLTMSITAQSYYQPAKSLNFTTKVVK